MTGPELKQTRKLLGRSQQALADELEIARETVNRWEAELRPIPSIYAKAIHCLAYHRHAAPEPTSAPSSRS